jgi:hypothetical protein
MTPTRIQAEWNEATRGDHSVLADWGVEVICLQQDRGTEKAGAMLWTIAVILLVLWGPVWSVRTRPAGLSIYCW